MNYFRLQFEKSLKATLHRALALVLMSFFSIASANGQKPADKITYDDHVKPILMQRCSSCHNSNKREGDVDVTNYTNLMMGGGSGEVISPQDASDSYLYKLITHEESPEMPPSGTKIPDPEIQMIAKWINLGALENKGSKAAKAKPKLNMALTESPSARPTVMPMPLRMPIEPVVRSKHSSVLAIATSPWAPVVALATPKQILLYNTQTLQLSGVLPIEEGVAHSLRFSRNGQLLLAGGGKDGASGKAFLYNVLTGERITSVGEELEAVLAADISANQELIALGGPNKLVKVHNTSDGSNLFEINKHTDWVTALEFSPDGKYLATGDRNGGLFVWEADSGNEVFTLKGHTKAITEISWRSDSNIVASASEDTTIRTWEMKDGKQIKSWGAHGAGVTSIEFQRGGNLVSCGRDRVAKVWDQNGKMLKQVNGLSDVAVSVSYCDETKRIIASDWKGLVKVWNEADGKAIGNLAGNPPRLAERLAAAEQHLAQTTTAHAPLAAKEMTTKTQVEATGKSLQQSKQTQVQTQTKLTQHEQQFAATKKQFESTKTQHAQWRKELDEKSAAQPLIKETLDKSKAALAKLPNDQDLKNATATYESKLAKIDARVNELKGLVAKSNQEKNTTKAQMDQLAKAVQTSKSEMQNITSQVNKLQGQLAKMNEQMKKDSQAAAIAKTQIDNANALVNRWKGDIAFIGALNTLKQNLASTNRIIEEKQAVVDQANKKLSEAKNVVDQAVNQKTAVEKQAQAIQQQLHQLRGGK